MYSVHIAPGGSRKTLPYLENAIKKASREGLVDAALCAGKADLLIVPRGAAADREARCRLTVGAEGGGSGDVRCGLGEGNDLGEENDLFRQPSGLPPSPKGEGRVGEEVPARG